LSTTWRPFVFWIGLAAAIGGLGVALNLLDHADPGLGVVAFLVIAAFMAYSVAEARWRGRAFLKGLRSGGVEARVASEEATWLGTWRLRLATAGGEWIVVSKMGRYSRVFVQAPGSGEQERLWGSPRRAGRDAARAATGGEEWAPALPSWARGRK
jgi:hypothetical protein